MCAYLTPANTQSDSCMRKWVGGRKERLVLLRKMAGSPYFLIVRESRIAITMKSRHDLNLKSLFSHSIASHNDLIGGRIHICMCIFI